MKKVIYSKYFKIFFLLISEIILGTLLKIDHNLSWIGIAVVLLFWGVLSHMFIEWLKFEEDFKELKESKSYTERLLNEFAESNFLMNSMARSVKSDLEFDKHVKLKTEHKPFQLFISALKYEYYLSSYFKYNLDANSPAITNIPRYYFESYTKQNGEKYSVWMWLIEKSKTYQSIQILNNDTSEIYLDNKERLEIETNYLKTQYQCKNAKLSTIKKLFVIKDEWMDADGKIITEANITSYLDVWKIRLKSMTKTSKKNLQVKYIKMSLAKGSLNNGYIDDIGIFDSILGIQSPIKTENSLIDDKSDISFYFDKEFVESNKEKFETVFATANPLF
jgi:hypothetical protein